jgi:hypothetical protein
MTFSAEAMPLSGEPVPRTFERTSGGVIDGHASGAE